MAKPLKPDTDKKKQGSLFILAGLFLGMGFGFAFYNVPAGIFIGLGVGVTAWAYMLVK